MSEVNPYTSPQASELSGNPRPIEQKTGVRRWVFYLLTVCFVVLASQLFDPSLFSTHPVLISGLLLSAVSALVLGMLFAPHRPEARRSGVATFFVDTAKLIGFSFLALFIIIFALLYFVFSGLEKDGHNSPFEKICLAYPMKTAFRPQAPEGPPGGRLVWPGAESARH